MGNTNQFKIFNILKYILFNTEAEAKTVSSELWSMVSSGNTSALMFSVRPNNDRTQFALMVDDTFTAEIRKQDKLEEFNVKHKTKFKKGKKNIHDFLKNSFTMVNKLDGPKWE